MNTLQQNTHLTMSDKTEEIIKFAKRTLLNISCLECYKHTRFEDYEHYEDGSQSLKQLLEEYDYSIDKIIELKTQRFFDDWNATFDPSVPKIEDITDDDEIEEIKTESFDIFVSSFDFRELSCLDVTHRNIFINEFAEIMEL